MHAPSESLPICLNKINIPLYKAITTLCVYFSGGADYNVVADIAVTISAGQTEAFFSVATTADDLAEGAETFTVTMSAPTGAGLGAGTVATVTINDRKSERIATDITTHFHSTLHPICL